MLQFGKYRNQELKDVIRSIEKEVRQRSLENDGKMKDSQDTTVENQCSFKDACEQYEYYKSKTCLKVHANDPDFEQNMNFRKFF